MKYTIHYGVNALKYTYPVQKPQLKKRYKITLPDSPEINIDKIGGTRRIPASTFSDTSYIITWKAKAVAQLKDFLDLLR